VEPPVLNIYRPDWMEQAACTNVDPVIFFPGPGKANAAKTKQAKELCRTVQ